MTTRIIKEYMSRVLILSMVLMMLFVGTSCSKNNAPTLTPEYGTYGADFARELATTYPYRTAYSSSESAAGEMIEDELIDLGFDVEVQPFYGSNGSISNNYIVRIEGDGFMALDEETGEYSLIHRTAVIGAHYDVPVSSSSVSYGSVYNGISDNASGIGCIMTVASQIKNYKNNGFDVIIVAFGAGTDDYAGAKAFLSSLTEEEKANIEVMYCIDSIYAGDKIYASSGYNSLITTQKYSMRRKLYQVYDVAYDSMLSSKYGFNLLYNESSLQVDLNGDGINDIYREVSTNKSDYVPFDNANIQIVFFDSYDYYFDKMEDMKETKNLNLQEFGGQVRGTALDSTDILDPIYMTEEEDRLEIRINNVAFCILESMLKGSDAGLTLAEYENMPAETEETTK